MAAVNASLKLLASGSAASKAQMEQAATRAMAALEALRSLRESVPALAAKPLDAERAALALVSALAAQSMVRQLSSVVRHSSGADERWTIRTRSGS